MPKAPVAPTPAAPAKRSIDWKAYGARDVDEGDRITWRPSREGDRITGILSRADEVQTRFGSKVVVELDTCTSVIAGGVDTEDGNYTLWPTPGLINALDEVEADRGDHIIVTLAELIDTGKGNPFRRYEVSSF